MKRALLNGPRAILGTPLLLLLAGFSSELWSQENLQAGGYLSPLVQLQRLHGEEDHLHVDEVRLGSNNLLLQCSYTFGVVDAANAAHMRYLSQNIKHSIPGDSRRPGCIHLAPDGDVVYTTHRGNIRNPTFLSGWDITNPEAPVQLPVLQEPGVRYEGVDVANGNIFVGLHDKGLGVYRRDEDGNFRRLGTATGFANAWGVTARNDTVFVADAAGGLVIVDATDPSQPTVVGRATTGGQASGVVVDRDIAYVAAGSAGLVVVDVSDLANPKVIGNAEMPGSAVRVAHSAGHVFVAAWNDARVYDVSVPATPRFVGAVRLTTPGDFPDGDRPDPTSRILGIAARNDEVFVGNWHLLHSYRLHPERRAPSIRLPESASLLDFGPVENGESHTLPFEITNQGTAPLTLLSVKSFGSAFTAEPQQARVAPGETVTLSLTFRPTTAETEQGYLQILSDDPLAPIRTAYLIGNLSGLGVGSPLPAISAVLLDGRRWSSSETRGKVTLLAYFATF